MKLLSRYNKINLTATLIVLFISSIAYYSILRYMLINGLDDDLRQEQKEIIAFVKAHNALPDAANYREQQTQFHEVKSLPAKKKFSTQEIFNKAENENEETRRLVFPVVVNGKNYEAAVTKSQEATEDLLQLIVGITLCVVIFLLGSVFFVNRFFLSKLWQPFYKSLDEMQRYNLSAKNGISFMHSRIDEFNQLNRSIAAMTMQAQNEYNSLKTFTENASHEIQTPLAIIKAKLELLSQSENLEEKQLLLIQSAQQSVKKLSKLNQSLLLLTKIENRQFSENMEIYFEKIIKHYLAYYEELLLAKEIKVSCSFENAGCALMNEALAEILISNLIINAIKHNNQKGFINIHLMNNEFLISNSGNMLQSEAQSMFQRFKKDNAASGSSGLGLSIVQKICERYNFEITYQHNNSLHILSLRF